MITTKSLQLDLTTLGYDAGPIDGIFGDRTRSAVKAFQSDLGLQVDGIYGPQSDAALGPLLARVTDAIGDLKYIDQTAVCRRMRVTSYYLIEETDYSMSTVVPIYQNNLDGTHTEIARVGPAFFAHASLEGTARLHDGTLINVQGGTTVVNPADYKSVLDYAKADGFSHVEYAGIRLDASGTEVVRAITFVKIPAADIGKGYGLEHGIAKDPWRTCAADPSIFQFGDHVYIAELSGIALPNGTVHSGYLEVNDTGSAIQGLHLDWFVGTQTLYRQGPKQPEFPRLCHAASTRLASIPLSYTNGLIPS